MQKRKIPDAIVRYLVLIVLFILSTIITINNNGNIDTPTKITEAEFWAAYLFKFSPIIILAALEGVVPCIISCFVLFITKTVMFKELAYTTAIYIAGGALAHYFSMMEMFSRKRKTLLVMLFYMFFYGSLWGGILGIIAGRGFQEFTPSRSIFYFLNEFPEAFLAVAIPYIIFGLSPCKVKSLFISGVYYRTDVSLLEKKIADFRKSKLAMTISLIIAVLATALGVCAAVYSNTLIPQMKKTTQAVSEDTDWDEITNVVALELLVSKMEQQDIDAGNRADSFILKFNDQTLIFDTKLIMLILIVVIPLAVLANQYALRRIARPIHLLADSIGDFYDLGERGLDENLAHLKELNIRTNDEIETMYRNFVKTAETMVSFIRTIQAQRTLADELRAEQMANQAKNNFMSAMSHEIRTPINAMLGFNEMIMRESNDPEITKYAANVNSSGRLLLGLVNDVLDFSRIEAGKTEIIPVEYDVSSMINDLINTASVRTRGKNIDFKTEIDNTLPVALFGDELRIKQCAMNIITNAIKYTPEGTVTLIVNHEKIDDENISLQIKVTDTGIGIREEDMAKLFAPFERIEEDRNRTIEGTGLGMNIVKKLLALMDSELLVSSTYGKGSTFSFILRQKVINWNEIGDFAATYEETLLGAETYHESFHAPDARILVVDDTLANLTVIQGLLKQTQIQVDVAESGYEALDLVCEKKYNMIFLDHRMPRMDGIETFRAMKELDGNLNRDVPVYALTANVIAGARELYIDEGFSGYIPKPVDSRRLEAVIQNSLPRSLVIRPDDEEFVPIMESEEISSGDLEAIRIMTAINGIDYEAGARNCGGPVQLKNVATDFAYAIKDRSSLIESAWKDHDYKNYTTYVHGLKSSARVIGASELSNLAAYLEQCGSEMKTEEIDSRTDELLAIYRRYIDYLQPLLELADRGSEDKSKPLIAPEELAGALKSLKEFVEGSYFDSADDIVAMMDDYRMPDDFIETYREIKKLLSAVDRDALLQIL